MKTAVTITVTKTAAGYEVSMDDGHQARPFVAATQEEAEATARQWRRNVARGVFYGDERASKIVRVGY